MLSGGRLAGLFWLQAMQCWARSRLRLVRGAGSGTRASRPKRATSSPKEHWGSSGFASTDLEFRSKQQRIMKVIAVGPLANTCIECTSRFAAVLGQQVTLATA